MQVLKTNFDFSETFSDIEECIEESWICSIGNQGLHILTPQTYFTTDQLYSHY